MNTNQMIISRHAGMIRRSVQGGRANQAPGSQTAFATFTTPRGLGHDIVSQQQRKPKDFRDGMLDDRMLRLMRRDELWRHRRSRYNGARGNGDDGWMAVHNGIANSNDDCCAKRRRQ
jgi:hypothetical protein